MLQYGDAPSIEPGAYLAKIFVAMPEDLDVTRPGAQGDLLRAFGDLRGRGAKPVAEARSAIVKAFGQVLPDLQRDLGPLDALMLISVNEEGVSRVSVRLGAGPSALPGKDPSLTPVMARLGPEDLETLDILIATGIAASRAEAVRWALARIRDRPAYEQIRARSREIEDSEQPRGASCRGVGPRIFARAPRRSGTSTTAHPS